MKNKQTNFQEKTDGVKPYIAYEKDFEKTNDFYEESLENQICMNYDFFPGIYNGEKWIKGDSSETESYYVEFCYRNQNMVEIFFGANDHGKKFEKSFALLRSAAKKFYLNNVDLEREVIKFSSISERIEIQKAEKWEDLCEIIETYKTKIPEKRDYKLSGNNSEFQSWSKTMTVEEARELMTYLKMNVNFPE